MAVLEIERYTQKNGEDILKIILKPTKQFPNGYFYCDSCDEELIRRYSWFLYNQGYVVAHKGYGAYGRTTIKFHREKAFNILGFYSECINHINMVEFDNVDNNLDAVSQQQNCWARPSKGYSKNSSYRNFKPCMRINRQDIYTNCMKTEIDAIQLANWLEVTYKNYRYDFLKDRRNDLDILDMERTGKISEEEAVYRHVCRYALNNAWYYYRYNLSEYFRDNNLSVPAYTLDEQGFMVHSITGQHLCPM